VRRLGLRLVARLDSGEHLALRDHHALRLRMGAYAKLVDGWVAEHREDLGKRDTVPSVRRPPMPPSS
jgi:hypothetical protein